MTHTTCRRRAALFIAALALWVGAAGAQAPGAAAPAAGPGSAPGSAAPAASGAQRATAPVFVRELGGIEEYRLPNGLQVLLFPDIASTTTTVNITYRVGSRHEGPGEYGMAHLLEHLVFKGTPSNRDIPGEFARRGMRWNGTTTVDRTNYFASFNTNPQTLDFALALEADRMVNSFIAQADLAREMTVVRNEYERSENEPFQVLQKRVLGAAYAWHPYGKPAIGLKSDIESVPIERLQAFYRKHYRPDNATLLVAGSFDKAAVLARIQQHFGALKVPAEPLGAPYTQEPAQDGERSVVVRRVGGQPIVLAHYHVPALAHPDTPALLVYGLMMSLEPSGLLHRKLVEPRTAVAAFLTGAGQAQPAGVVAGLVLAADADIAKAEATLLELVEGRGAEPLQESELARVRELAAVAYRNQMKNPQMLAQVLSNVVAAGDWRLQFQIIEDIGRVTLADIERVRKAYFRPANRTVGRYLPSTQVERVEVPAAPPLQERLARLQGPPTVEQGEALDPSPPVLATRTAQTRLPSGLELITLRKATRGQAVQLRMELRWSTREATFPVRGTDMVGRLIPEGSARWSKQALQDELIKLRAGLSVTSGDQGATLVLTAERDTLLAALRIAADVVQNPLLPQEALQRHRTAAMNGLQGSRQEPQTLRAEAAREHYNRARGVGFGHPDYLKSLDDRIHAIQSTTLEDIRGMHRDWWSANEARVSVVGALPEGLEAEIEALFGAWKKPAAGRFVRHEPRHVPVPAARFDAKAPDKANAVLRMHQTLALSAQDADFPPAMLVAHVLGGGALENRLAARVRQQEGLSYSVSAGLSAPWHGNAAALEINASFSPADRERLIKLILEELQKLAEHGITEAELARARNDLLQGWQQARNNDAALASQLLSLADQQRDWLALQRREQSLLALSVEQVNAIWRRLVRPDAFVVSTAGDYKD